MLKALPIAYQHAISIAESIRMRGLSAPTLFVRDALRGETKKLFVQPLRGRGILPEYQVTDPELERLNHRLGRSVARSEAETLDSILRANADKQLIRSRHDEIADPVSRPIVRSGKDLNVKFHDFHRLLRICTL